MHWGEKFVETCPPKHSWDNTSAPPTKIASFGVILSCFYGVCRFISKIWCLPSTGGGSWTSPETFQRMGPWITVIYQVNSLQRHPHRDVKRATVAVRQLNPKLFVFELEAQCVACSDPKAKCFICNNSVGDLRLLDKGKLLEMCRRWSFMMPLTMNYLPKTTFFLRLSCIWTISEPWGWYEDSEREWPRSHRFDGEQWSYFRIQWL